MKYKWLLFGKIINNLKPKNRKCHSVLGKGGIMNSAQLTWEARKCNKALEQIKAVFANAVKVILSLRLEAL